MKNNHGIEPTQFKIKDTSKAIYCGFDVGPIFGDFEICVYGRNDEPEQYIINLKGAYGCEDNSLFIGGTESKGEVSFEVLDFEVYCIDNYNSYIRDTCKHPNVICECFKTKDISKESLKQFDDDIELLHDLDAAHCNNFNLYRKVSRHYLKNPSKLLPKTQLVDRQYDSYLREWLGKDYKWKLIHRTSEHKYSSESFHDCCDDKGPTLTIIKCTNGCIFGGYTAQSWSGYSI